MAVKLKLKPSKSTPRLSSPSLEKLIQTHKSPPKLWLDHHITPVNDQGVRTLSLTHPILRTLESCKTALKEFNQVHTQLIISDLFQHPLSFSRVVKKLCSCQNLVSHAAKLFNYLEQPDAFICNTIIRGYVNFNDPKSGLTFYYCQMVGKCVSPNHYTFPVVFKACADMGFVREGERAHTRVVKLGFELDLFVRNSLIHMYSVCGRIGDARVMFDMGSESDMVTWNSMIDGCVKNGDVGFARFLFDEMPERDSFSWNSMIAGYVGIGDMEMARGLFDKMACRDIVSWNCLIDGYARVGDVVAARESFDRMPLRNVVSWNIMLALYARSKDYNECLSLFDRMMEVGDVKANEATIMSVLTACAHLGRLDKGKSVHSYIKSNMKIKSDVLLSTALLTMYSKCGAMDLAKGVFDEMQDRSVVSWNSMIMGYGVHGHGEKALQMFVEMERSRVVPNDATFICVLSACTHAGMVLEGWWYFDLMRRVYKIEPKVEHYGCMVDLLGRAGLMKDSEEIIKNMPMEAGSALWGALLSACRTHSNTELGEIVAKQLIELKPADIGSYVLLSNIYAAEGRWDDVENVREMMKRNGLQKVAGSSLVHFGDSEMESFQGNDSVHKRSMVYSMLKDIGAQLKLSCRKME